MSPQGSLQRTYLAYLAFIALLFGKRAHEKGTYNAYIAYGALLFGKLSLMTAFPGNERAYRAFSGSGKTLAFEGHGLQPVRKWL
jgi:hypothetical protein